MEKNDQKSFLKSISLLTYSFWWNQILVDERNFTNLNFTKIEENSLLNFYFGNESTSFLVVPSQELQNKLFIKLNKFWITNKNTKSNSSSVLFSTKAANSNLPRSFSFTENNFAQNQQQEKIEKLKIEKSPNEEAKTDLNFEVADKSPSSSLNCSKVNFSSSLPSDSSTILTKQTNAIETFSEVRDISNDGLATGPDAFHSELKAALFRRDRSSAKRNCRDDFIQWDVSHSVAGSVNKSFYNEKQEEIRLNLKETDEKR